MLTFNLIVIGVLLFIGLCIAPLFSKNGTSGGIGVFVFACALAAIVGIVTLLGALIKSITGTDIYLYLDIVAFIVVWGAGYFLTRS